MPANYTLIEKITVGAAGASSVTFSGIPQTGYTDLVVKISARNDASNVAGGVWLYPNGSSANMTGRILAGTGSVAVSGTDTKVYGYTNSANSTASTFGNIEFYIPNYTSSNNKSISVDSVMENNATEGRQGLMAGLWSITSAITSLEFQTFNNSTSAAANFVSGSTFYLYGVAKLGTTPAIVPYATGGDTIMTDGTYWYHAFKSSGTFTPQTNLTCDYLVVAGGGGGGNAGGGAGGLRAITASSFASNTNYTVTIGAGGGGGSPGANGSNSVFNSTTSTGGGGGGVNGGSGVAGGSGGGGAVLGATAGAGGTGTAGQGSAGGAGVAVAPGLYSAGGGGGAGAAGASNVGTTVGAGGAGVNTYSSWLSPTGLGVSGYIAGGGGAAGNITTSAGGAGGGGQGDNATTGNGVANTGSGGGGGYSIYLGNGGSGLVIVRYLVV